VKKFFCLIIFFLTLLVFLARPAQAARKRVVKSTSKAAGQVSVSRGVGSWVRFRPDRLALLINFSNFGNIQSGSYELTYQANGVGQGAGGSIILGDTDTKTLLFGTCSTGVCTFHTNITGAKLTITSTLKTGQKVLKTYRIRV
jgi:hypothetical protein